MITYVPVRIQLSQRSFHSRTDVEMSDGKSAWPGCFRWRTGTSTSTFQAIVLRTKNHWLAGSRINLRARSVALKKQMETCQSPSVDPASSTPCPRSRNSHTANPRALPDNDSDFLVLDPTNQKTRMMNNIKCAEVWPLRPFEPSSISEYRPGCAVSRSMGRAPNPKSTQSPSDLQYQKQKKDPSNAFDQQAEPAHKAELSSLKNS